MVDRFEYQVATLTGNEGMLMVPPTMFMLSSLKLPRAITLIKDQLLHFAVPRTCDPSIISTSLNRKIYRERTLILPGGHQGHLEVCPKCEGCLQS